MPKFEPKQSIDTEKPTVEVEAGLPVGRHRFQLEVFNAAGSRGQSDVVIVEIRDRE